MNPKADEVEQGRFRVRRRIIPFNGIIIKMLINTRHCSKNPAYPVRGARNGFKQSSSADESCARKSLKGRWISFEIVLN